MRSVRDANELASLTRLGPESEPPPGVSSPGG